MDLHHLAGLLADQSAGGRAYLEFLRSESLLVGLYVLRVGDVDRQQPHREDEVYVVMSGRSRFTAGDETREVTAGDTIFVAAGVPHRFHDIADDLHLIVVFAPPETAPADTPAG
jgi:mannose-6-phosphate isomerase-like protein (cupin superfamily)